MARRRKDEMSPTIPADPQPHPLGGTVDEPGQPDQKPKPNSSVKEPMYQTANGPELAFMRRIVEKYHAPLHKEKVDIALQFWRDPEGAPSVKTAGVEEFGKVRVLSADQRAAGAPDMRIIIDGHKWDNATVDEQEAALDHLLEQKELCTTEKGEVLRDKAGRPKLRRRKFDVFIKGYARVAKEHGVASLEAKAFHDSSKHFSQMRLFEDTEVFDAPQIAAN